MGEGLFGDARGEGRAEAETEDDAAYAAADDPTAEIEPVGEAAGEGAEAPARRKKHGSRKAAAAALGAGAVAIAVIAGAGIASIASRTAIDSGREDTYEQAQAGTGADAQEPSASQGSSGGAAAQAVHEHSWQPQYGVVHVDRQAHVEHRAAVAEAQAVRETVCNRCQAVITGKTAEHRAETGHDAWTTNVPVMEEVEVEPARDVEVVDAEEHDEYRLAGYACECGAELTADEARETGVWREADEQRAEAE